MDEEQVKKLIEKVASDSQYNNSPVPYHTHNGVDSPMVGTITSLAKSGSTALLGDVFLVGGTNVTLAQSGQTITVAVPTVGLTTSFDYQSFTTPGANTWTKPAACLATSLVYVQIWAGGGGGGGQNIATDIASGGGGGECQEMLILASQLGSTVAVTIGAGGIGGTNTSGLIGTASTFGNFVRAEPGDGGVGSTPGVGGKYNTRDVNSGADGGAKGASGANAIKGGGGGSGAGTGAGLNGGTSKLGGAGGSAPTGNGAGIGGSTPAGGGSASTRITGSGNLKGGDGARGECRVWTFF